MLADVRKEITEVEPKILVLDAQVPNEKQDIVTMLQECYAADAYQ